MKVLAITLVLTLTTLCLADESPVALSETSNIQQCDNDEDIANICLQCSSLPFEVFTSIDTCCSNRNAFLFCEACVNDKDSCKTLLDEIEDVNEFSEDEDDDMDDYYDMYDDYTDMLQKPEPLQQVGIGSVDKRFGKLFVKSPKRFGRVLFGKRSGTEGDFDKRYGRIYMGGSGGSYYGKRNMMDKRYGRLYMNSNGWFGKRSGDVDNLYDGYMDDLDVAKRYGRVYMGGSRYNKLFGKRNGYDKRYGRIFMGGKGLFGKRSTESNYLMDYPENLDKRSEQFALRPKVYEKRFGRLFTGRRRGKYLFG
ncbi:hypothetical protein ACF0H5_021590 [Mactra antiquata]